MDWGQILVRKVINLSAQDIQSVDVDISVVIGNLCTTPMLCDSAFILRFPEEHLLASDALPPVESFICSYKKIEKTPWLLTKKCILDLDSDTLDVKLFEKLEIGAFFVNISSVYAGFSQYGNQDYQKIKRGYKLPEYQSIEGVINLKKLFGLKHSLAEWIYSIHKLRPDIPFGIRMPANFIERDVILAVFCEVDFIILDCPDTLPEPCEKSTPLVPSLAAIVRIVSILSKLNSLDVKIIVGTTTMFPSDCFKLLALGASLILIDRTSLQYSKCDNHLNEQDCVKPELQISGDNVFEYMCDLNRKACDQLKKDIMECGCGKLAEISKANLLTTSFKVKEFTEIPTIADADSVSLPLYHIKPVNKRKSY